MQNDFLVVCFFFVSVDKKGVLTVKCKERLGTDTANQLVIVSGILQLCQRVH